MEKQGFAFFMFLSRSIDFCVCWTTLCVVSTVKRLSESSYDSSSIPLVAVYFFSTFFLFLKKVEADGKLGVKVNQILGANEKMAWGDI